MQSVLACRSQLVSSAQRDRSPLEQIWFDTIFQYIINLVLFSIQIYVSVFSNIKLKNSTKCIMYLKQYQTKSAPAGCDRAEPS